MTLLKNRTRKSLKIGDSFALSRNPGFVAFWRGTTMGPTIERWHKVAKIEKRREPIGGELSYRVSCSSCGNVGTIYEDAKMDIRRGE